ncbi:mannose-1-phosphate guanylyltransferase (GDP) /mannose-6-phosphate isomerase type 2 [Hasllibacter halocynthiae]|uniref:mannose-1-phosphate guanylyltransferase n=1 Tax=Hasllibacter halocynthiae TaxID=595589 RepID=A0A2T0X1I8_9RHOB|nr:mannose-1-phosphate guanylyltransferase/mannose-6-phosphate isomerase [Hasllibacter halocynthiae]PRY92812.1 mannose-1-phosphate guanylyltransferase (GDP) /mannose-6-phosphate isomerase type 2 [Hasllibacter halocynthiae]
MIHPIILCGGSGTRLWPLSRKAHPKQFVDVLGHGSLFASCARMLSGEGFAAPTVVTASDFRFLVAEQLVDAAVDPGPILIEPEPRNTAPAILAAAMAVALRDPAAVILVAPSDHAISDPEAFRECMRAACPVAEAGHVVTFGIRPTHAETGYGWLELDGGTLQGTHALRRFVEKPDQATAEAMLARGGHLWNAGIFMARADAMVSAFERHAPDMVEHVRTAVGDAGTDLGFLRLAADPWSKVRAQSIDYAVMEPASTAEGLYVQPYDGGWTDLGGWNSIWREMERGADGVAARGATTAIDCRDSLLRSEVDGLELVGIGLENIVAVAMNDAVLVADLGRVQDVKLAVERLRTRGAAQAEAFPYDHRPWGHFETLALDERFQVKRIVVHPGAALSLQSHHHRAEHWIVVSGTARVTVDDEVSLVTENGSIYVPLGAVHRMENPGKVPMVLIEVQTGSYLGEDDIVRYEDVYARGQGAKG